MIHNALIPDAYIFRVLERGQYAYKIDKDGTWFFTLSISTTQDESNGDVKKDRQVVVGQLARKPKDGSIEVLLRIDNFIDSPKNGEKERKIQVCQNVFGTVRTCLEL